MIMLLGRRDVPTDGVEDYCSFLSQALSRRDIAARSVRVAWDQEGWIHALLRVWHESATWSNQWVLLQYTTMGWSRRGFPFGALAVQAILCARGIRRAVLFHEAARQPGDRWVDRVRGACQEWIIQRLYDGSAKGIFAEPLQKIEWLPKGESKAVFIPIGANIPEVPAENILIRQGNGNAKTVAVFCLSNPPNRSREIADISHAMRSLAEKGLTARVVFLGRGTDEAKEEIERAFASLPVGVQNLGLQSADEIRRVLSESDAMLCVRGQLYVRRGSAIAGIACGLPIVAWGGAADGTPIAEAGVELVPYGDREALADALAQALEDDRCSALRRKSLDAYHRYFSWDAIASLTEESLKQAGESQRMKLLIYTHDWAPSLGGVQTITMALARLVATETTERVDVTLVTQTPRGDMDDEALPFRVVRQPRLNELVRLFRAADVVHIASAALRALCLAWALRKPVALEHHGYQASCPNGLLVYGTDRSVCPGHYMVGRYTQCVRCNVTDMGWKGSLRALVLTFPRRWLAKRVSRNIAPSLHVSQRVSLPNTQLVYHGVRDPDANSFPSFGQSNGNSAVFAYVGRLVAEKGVPILLRASAQLRGEGYDVRLKIIGDGAQRMALETMATTLGLTNSIEFVGHVPVESIAGQLVGVTGVVVPSVWEDVAPLAVTEQLMLGNLVIASDIGGLAELVGDAGLTFRAGDSGALASRMREALENQERARDMKIRARKRASEKFAEDRMVEEHLRVYQAISKAPQSSD